MTMNSLNPILERVTQRITERSAPTRRAYLDHMAAQRTQGTQRAGLGCANMAHTTAALPPARDAVPDAVPPAQAAAKTTSTSNLNGTERARRRSERCVKTIAEDPSVVVKTDEETRGCARARSRVSAPSECTSALSRAGTVSRARARYRSRGRARHQSLRSPRRLHAASRRELRGVSCYAPRLAPRPVSRPSLHGTVWSLRSRADRAARASTCPDTHCSGAA